jgi:processive 1,2-diacylglycerol beta-glucosyltransferase
MDRPGMVVYDSLRILIQDLNKLPMTRYVRQRHPRLIVNTHYFPAEVIAQMRRAGQLDCPQVTITTDFETHRLWAQEPTERYYTATEQGKAYLTTWGVAPERVLVTGIPVRPGFQTPLPQAEARARCELATDRPTVLLLCAGFRANQTCELVRELCAMPQVAQVVAITGRDARLQKRLERLSGSLARALRVIGFTDRMHEWMWASDLVVSKPGGLTVSETLACGVPLVILNPIPGQETRNSDYLLECGAAVKVNNVRLLGHRVHALLTHPDRLVRLREAARAIARPAAAQQIAADALTLAKPAAAPGDG